MKNQGRLNLLCLMNTLQGRHLAVIPEPKQNGSSLKSQEIREE